MAMNPLPAEYEEEYRRVFREYAANAPSQGKYTAFWPVIGRNYPVGNGLMVVGRAVNGWTNGSDIRVLRTEHGLAAEIEEGRKESEKTSERDSPEEWLKEPRDPPRKPYNWRRSAFWRVAHDFAVDDSVVAFAPRASWPSHLAYSNLVKIAPSGGGNPNAQRSRLLEASAPLLQLEIESLRPACVLILAGQEWYDPFLRLVGPVTALNDNQFVHGIAAFASAHILLAEHPQTRPHRRFVEALAKAWHGEAIRQRTDIAEAATRG